MNARLNKAGITQVANGLVACTRCHDCSPSGQVVVPFVGKDVRCMVLADSYENEAFLLSALKNCGISHEELIYLHTANCYSPQITECQINCCRIINQFYIDNGGIDHILAIGKWSCHWFNYQSQWQDKKVYLMETFDKGIVSKFCVDCHEEFIPF